IAVGPRGCGSMAERKLPKLETGVRFPSPALSRRELDARNVATPRPPNTASNGDRDGPFQNRCTGPDGSFEPDEPVLLADGLGGALPRAWVFRGHVVPRSLTYVAFCQGTPGNAWPGGLMGGCTL